MLKSATTSSSPRRSALIRAIVPAIAIAALFPAQALAGTVSQSFSQPGETAFTVPANVNQINIDAFGAPGGGSGGFGGAGAEVQGDLSVTPGQTLYLEVGIGGGNPHYLGANVGGPGGGESDVRTCSATAQTCTIPGYGTATSAQTQLLVAAGGGGSGGATSDAGGGGDAGLLNGNGADGQSSANAGGGHGATVSAPGLGGSSASGGPSGSSGSGNLGGDGWSGGGAGGAGRYGGGGGGGVGVASQGAAGGGGGSSWVNQDATGVGAYLTHITGASSAASTAAPHIVISYTPTQAVGLAIATPTSQELVNAYPEFSGTGSGNPGDQQSVTVSIYTGQTATGAPVQTFSTALDSSHQYDAKPTSPLASGTYTAVISQQDAGGKTGSNSVTFVVDATGPAVTITQPADGLVTATTPTTFGGDAGTEPNDTPNITFLIYAGTDESGENVELAHTGVTADGHWEVQIPRIQWADGPYLEVVKQTDSVGNTTTRTATFTIDAPLPTASVTSPADGATYHVGDPVTAAYTCASTGSGIASCTGPMPNGATLDTTVVGQHTFTVQAMDNAGNLVSTTVHYTVAEVTPPAPPIPPTPPTPAGSATGQSSTPASVPNQQAATPASAGLRVLASHLRAVPHGCSVHPRPKRLSSRACSTAVVVTGVIDSRAAGQTLTLTWSDGHGHSRHTTVRLGRSGRWSTTLGLPAAAQLRRGSVAVSFAGDSALLAASASRIVAPAR
ncbi:MAG: Ig-like domain-containing protein [Solirubrobacteraceae bacterium]